MKINILKIYFNHPSCIRTELLVRCLWAEISYLICTFYKIVVELICQKVLPNTDKVGSQIEYPTKVDNILVHTRNEPSLKTLKTVVPFIASKSLGQRVYLDVTKMLTF